MEKYQFRRGCLVGNLLQEAPLLPEAFLRLVQAAGHARLPCRQDGLQPLCKCLGQQRSFLHTSPEALAQVFWIGWEGAVMRARLVQSAAPLNQCGCQSGPELMLS
jgi:TetR/AcrR family transcriptional repressor of nem operon